MVTALRERLETVVLNISTKDFRATLERGLSQSERHFLDESIKGFFEIYGLSRLKFWSFNFRKKICHVEIKKKIFTFRFFGDGIRGFWLREHQTC